MTPLKSTAFAGLSVLIVEDEYFLASDVKRLLDEHEASVVGPFPSAYAARSAVGDKRIDFAILDINLGDHDVLSLAAEFEFRKLPFLFLTGYSRAAVPDRFSHVPLVRKPCDDSELLDAILALGLAPNAPAAPAIADDATTLH